MNQTNSNQQETISRTTNLFLLIILAMLFLLLILVSYSANKLIDLKLQEIELKRLDANSIRLKELQEGTLINEIQSLEEYISNNIDKVY